MNILLIILVAIWLVLEVCYLYYLKTFRTKVRENAVHSTVEKKGTKFSRTESRFEIFGKKYYVCKEVSEDGNTYNYKKVSSYIR